MARMRSYHSCFYFCAHDTFVFQSDSVLVLTFIIFILITSFVVREQCEAIKTRTQCFNGWKLFIFFDAKHTEKSPNAENLSENRYYRHRSWKCTQSGEALTVLLPQEQNCSLDSQKSWSMRTGRWSEIACKLCLHTMSKSSFPIHIESGKKKKQKSIKQITYVPTNVTAVKA